MIPGFIISILTFPGTMLHEFAHKFFCDRLGVRVLKVVYFRFGNPTGYVLHEKPATFKQTFWISVGPLIINSLACILLGMVCGLIPKENPAGYAALWLTLSVGMHAFPSDQDAGNILASSKAKLAGGESALHRLSYPFFWLIWLANKLRFFWFDLFYAVVLYIVGSTLIGANP